MEQFGQLSGRAWPAIEPHLPHGWPVKPRVDDRRVIFGTLHVLETGCRWRDVPSGYGSPTRIYSRSTRWSLRGIWQRMFATMAAGGPVPEELSLGSTHVKAHRSAQSTKGGRVRRRSASRGAAGKIHGLADAEGRAVALALTPGNTSDIHMAIPLLEGPPRPKRLIADKAYDAMTLRRWLKTRRIRAVIPSLATQTFPFPLDSKAYKRRYIIERMWSHLKSWRRIATRYDRLARSYLASLALVSVVVAWT